MKNEPNTEQLANSALHGFTKLIDSAPLESSQPKPAGKDSIELKRCHGWGEKYIEREDLVGERWISAFSEAREFIATGGIIAFLGGRGTGKTRMAAEIARAGDFHSDSGEWNGHRMVFQRTAIYRRAMDIFLDLRDAAKRGSDVSERDVMDRMVKPGLMVIDEFQERGETEWENRIMSNLIDRRYAEGKPTILIANLSREEMARVLSNSVRDRIRENGKAIIFDWESYRKQK